MKRNQLVALAAVVLLATLVIVLAVRGRQPPRLPAGPEHARFVSPNACLTCHGPGGVFPQERNHPPRTDCMTCHGRS